MKDQAEHQSETTSKPPRFSFDLFGSVFIDGIKYENPVQVEVVIEGEVCTSGCGDAAIAHAFGINNIVTAVGDDEVLSNFSADQLIDHMINNHNIDLERVISELKSSLE